MKDSRRYVLPQLQTRVQTFASARVLLLILLLAAPGAPVLAQNPRQPVETGQQRAADARADKNEADLEAAITKACLEAHALFPKPQTVSAIVVPSSTQVGTVNLSWSPVPGLDSSVHYFVQAHIYEPQPSPSDVPEGQPLAYNVNSLAVSDLPLFFPVRFGISASKQIPAPSNVSIFKSHFLRVLNCQGDIGYSSVVVPTALPTARPVWGFADTHTHPFADRAFGGQLVIGQAFGDPTQAFNGDYVGHAAVVTQSLHKTGGYPNFDVCDSVGLCGWPTWNTLVHQQMYSDWLYRSFLGGLRLIVSLGVNNETVCFVNANQTAKDAGIGAAMGGAWLGGITAAIGGAIGGIVGAVESDGNVNCHDMDNADAQIVAAYEMEAYLDSQCRNSSGQVIYDPPRCPLPGKGWFHIVTSAEEARATINSGRLAVVLGVEVDRLFDCALTSEGDPRTGGHTCGPYEVDAGVEAYFKEGVRHIFPAHLANTAFAGMAVYPEGPIWNINNHFLNGHWIDAGSDACLGHPGITFDLNNGNDFPYWNTFVNNSEALLGGLGAQGNMPTYATTGACNRMGLTDLGVRLIQDLMAHHMIIDIDHMSVVGRDQTYILSGEPCHFRFDSSHAGFWPTTRGSADQCYPLIAGHTGFLGASASGNKRNENAKDAGDLSYIKSSGGLVSAGLNVGATTDVLPTGKVANDCSNSSKTWAQSYLYAVQQMGGPDKAAVAVASDQPLNPFLGPRFPCQGDSSGVHSATQGSPLAYPITVLTPGRHIHLGQSQLGNRTWDFNTDGMAHIGMYPDLIADLLNLGMTENDFQPLFRSAEQYIEMWEKAERLTPPSPPTPPSLPHLTVNVCPTVDGVNCKAATRPGAGRGTAGTTTFKALVKVTNGNTSISGASIDVSRRQVGITDANGIAVVTYSNCVQGSPWATQQEVVGAGETGVRGKPIHVMHRFGGLNIGCLSSAHKAGFASVFFRMPN